MDRYTEIQMDRILYELQKQTTLLENLQGTEQESDLPSLPELPPMPEPDEADDTVQRRT